MARAQTSPPSTLRERLFSSTFWSRYGIFLVFVGVCVLFTIITPWRQGWPVFLSRINILNIIRQVSIVGIMAVGMTYVIMARQIDLGVGSLLGVCGMVAAVSQRAGLGLVPSIVLPLLVGAATGLIVGLLVTRGNVPSFVVTLGVLASYRGISLLISGQPVLGMTPTFRFIGAGLLGDIPIFSQVPFVNTLPVPVVIFALAVTVGAIVFGRYPFGRHVAAVGGNPEAARLVGIEVDRVKIIVFVVSGVCAAISALILTSRLNSGQPLAGSTYELDVIAAVVVGGTSLSGGEGSVFGSVIGAMLIGVLANALTLMDVNPHWQPVIRGLIIVGAVLFDQYSRKRHDA